MVPLWLGWQVQPVQSPTAITLQDRITSSISTHGVSNENYVPILPPSSKTAGNRQRIPMNLVLTAMMREDAVLSTSAPIGSLVQLKEHPEVGCGRRRDRNMPRGGHYSGVTRRGLVRNPGNHQPEQLRVMYLCTANLGGHCWHGKLDWPARLAA